MSERVAAAGQRQGWPYKRSLQATPGYHRPPQTITGYHRLPQAITGYHRQATRGRPPARGGPTIYDLSTGGTNALVYSRATPCGWPARPATDAHAALKSLEEKKLISCGWPARPATDAHGQLVSVKGVIMTSCMADSGGIWAAKTIVRATLAGSCRFCSSGMGIPCSTKRSKK